MRLISIKPSTKAEKKLMAHFLMDDGKGVTVHFGTKGYDDYTLKKDKEQRDRYRKRHSGDKINVPNTISNTRESTIKT